MARPFYIASNIDSEIKKAIKDMDKYDETTQKKLRQAIKDGTTDTMRAAKGNVHSVTGNLVSRIVMDYNSEKNKGRVMSKAPHSHLIEFGVGSSIVLPKKKRVLKANGMFFRRAIIPARKAKPFMQTAIDKTRPAIERDIVEAIR